MMMKWFRRYSEVGDCDHQILPTIFITQTLVSLALAFTYCLTVSLKSPTLIIYSCQFALHFCPDSTIMYIHVSGI